MIGKLNRNDSKGHLMQTIAMPTDWPTYCEFGKRDLEILYVTSGTLNRMSEQLPEQKFSGGLYSGGFRVMTLLPFKG